MSTGINKSLLSYQITHAEKIIKILKSKYVCLDNSDTGTGKTYTAIATAKYLGMDVIIICPKTIIRNWQKVAELFNVKILEITNYETLIKAKTYKTKYEKIDSSYLNFDGNNMYKWNIPKNTMIIIDECHRCFGNNTKINYVLSSLKNIYGPDIHILLLSATLTIDSSKYKSITDVLNIYNKNTYPDWITNKKYNPKRARDFIEQLLFPSYACKINISDLGNLFQKRQVTAECYNEPNNKINDLYSDLKYYLQQIQDKKMEYKKGFGIMMAIRQKIEICKIPIFVDLAEQYIENNFSVIIFVNFTNTLNLLAKKLKTDCLIYGEQTLKTRHENIDDFMENKKHIIICNINAGSESINLHDKYGTKPRITLISPTFSGNKLVQAIGRTHRIDSKSVSINKIIYCANTIEEKICNKMNSMLIEGFEKINYEDMLLD